MSIELTTIGEILIDLTQTGVNENRVPCFAANPGGAPANVAVAASRLGANTAFIGCIGQDAFGDFLRKTLEENRVDTSGLIPTREAPTTLAVVTVDESGERSFSFYRSPGADVCLRWDMVPTGILDETAVLHFGSVSLTADPTRDATLKAAAYARDRGKLVTYDPNYRANLWPDEEAAIPAMRAPIPLVDVMKISDEETTLLTGVADPEGAAEALEKQGVRLVLVTLGPDGVLYRFRGRSGKVPGFSVKVADTNGAGDTFFGAVLSALCKRPDSLDSLEQNELEDILRTANRAASLTTSRPGAIPAMPTMEEVRNSLKEEE